MNQTINWTAINNVNDLLGAVNQTTGWFWTTMVWLVATVILIVLLPFGFESAVLATCFIGLILSIFLLSMGLVQFIYTTAIFAAVMLLVLLYIAFTSSRQ